MNEQERKEFLEVIKSYTEKVRGNKAESLKFLVGAGIVNSKGILTENYKHLCILQEQA